jgi:hypothetical protein
MTGTNPVSTNARFYALFSQGEIAKRVTLAR